MISQLKVPTRPPAFQVIFNKQCYADKGDGGTNINELWTQNGHALHTIIEIL